MEAEYIQEAGSVFAQLYPRKLRAEEGGVG
jgi:hypothetical protein